MVLIGAANAHLGLRVEGPGPHPSRGYIHGGDPRDNRSAIPLENNTGRPLSAQSVAAGAIFTLPALFICGMSDWGVSPSLVEISGRPLSAVACWALFMIRCARR